MSHALKSSAAASAQAGHKHSSLHATITHSWECIAPFWPLESLVAVNPLQGLEDMPFENALELGEAYFRHDSMPEPMNAVNRETIKWMQLFCDEGQATIPMPGRERGLYASWRALAPLDSRLQRRQRLGLRLNALPESPEAAINEMVLKLGIMPEQQDTFFALLLTTLPGWAAYVKYRTDWARADRHRYPISKADYLALRLVLLGIHWPEGKQLLDWHGLQRLKSDRWKQNVREIIDRENAYRQQLLGQLTAQNVPLRTGTPQAQLVFCIDVRSERFRRALEAAGDYETFGFAGFFGIPVDIRQEAAEENHACCPVLIKPRHRVSEIPAGNAWQHQQDRTAIGRLRALARHYQSAKYTFIAPLALMETLGIGAGVWMALRSLAPSFASQIKSQLVGVIRPSRTLIPQLDEMTLADKCAYAEGALRMIGLTKHFAPLVVFCGHGSTTENNPFASALDCGACGGRHGGGNARIIAEILNHPTVRQQLAQKGIAIPDTTRFIAAEHNTTTDEVILFDDRSGDEEVMTSRLMLKAALEEAREEAATIRLAHLGYSGAQSVVAAARRRSEDWAQLRPEWGLARNAAFIAAPRSLTRGLELNGRCFLHSYDWRVDPHGEYLRTIMTAPMIVAQWINAQYLFSTLDNVAYGAGSKVTMNITGKVGVMQGNASDLMHGLPLQSVCAADQVPYHEPQRLLSVVQAPRHMLDKVIAQQPVLQKLLGNGWVQLACLEPESGHVWLMQRDLTWRKT